MATNARTFTDKPATREATPLLVGLFGPSGGGKTYSALRLATGVRNVVGGEIFGIDTESRRMLHYADKFDFRHVQFGAPFGSLDYLAAVEHCVAHGAKVIIVDSASHEHEGPGGVLEQHSEETKRLAKAWNCSEDKAQIAAWAAPKQGRRRMINTLLQINANFVFCFRAREKLKIIPGKPPLELGFMPICGEEFFFEMTLSTLLLPGDKGVPRWNSDFVGEKTMMKLPGQFEAMFGQPKQLDEETGQKLAEWSAGMPVIDIAVLVKRYQDAMDSQGLAQAEAIRQEVWPRLKAAQKRDLKAASDAATVRLAPPKTEVF
jgi:hypothetical protein